MRTVAKKKARTTLVAKATAKATSKVAKSKAPAKALPRNMRAQLQGLSAWVINLDRRTDRWEKVKSSLAKQAPWLKANRLSAVDGAAAPPPKSEVTQKWSTAPLAKLFHWYSPVTVKMSPGERGCCGSHINAWRLAAKSRRPVVVLEDDAVALPAFSSSIAQAVKEAPKGTGMVFLSSKDRGYPKRVGKVLMEPYYVWTTVGYLIWPATALQLLGMLPMDMPVDNFLASKIKDGTVKAFSVSPAAVRQSQTWNVGSDVPHSDDVAH